MNRILNFGFVVLMSTLGAQYGWGTNGAYVIGPSAASQGMGGTGIARSETASDAAFKNPALMNSVGGEPDNFNFELHGTLINRSSDANGGLGVKKNEKNNRVVPDIFISHRITEDLGVGLGIIGFAGNEVEYDDTEFSQLQSSFSQARLFPAAGIRAYGPVHVGIAPFLSMGALKINEDSAGVGTRTGRKDHYAFGVGLQAGVSVRLDSGWDFGLTYTSKSKVTYKEIINLENFGPNAVTGNDNRADDLIVTHPWELGLGVNYAINETLRVAFDYRFVSWSTASTFQELGWQNQHILALGAQYTMDALKLRAGFNYAKAPVGNLTGEAGASVVNVQGHNVFASSLSLLNIVGFPAFIQTHITVGAGYAITESISADFAFGFSPRVTRVRSGTNSLNPNFPGGVYSYTGRSREIMTALGINWVF